MERLSKYGVKETNPTSRAWLEVIGLAAGMKTSSWKEDWETLDVEQQKLAQAEMAAELTDVLESLARVKPSSSFRRNQNRKSRITVFRTRFRAVKTEDSKPEISKAPFYGTDFTL